MENISALLRLPPKELRRAHAIALPLLQAKEESQGLLGKVRGEGEEGQERVAH